MRTATRKFHALQEHSEKAIINGPRPSPLMIHKNSHLIRKPSSSSTYAVASTKSHKQQRNPIIVHTKSPKVIYTKPRDFMALVQRLTGMTHSKENVFDATASLIQHQPQLLEAPKNFGSFLSHGSNINTKQQGKCGSWAKTSPDLRDGETCVKEEPFVEHSHPNLGFVDLPIFTPNYVFKYSDSPFGFLGSLLSPSGLEFMQELLEY